MEVQRIENPTPAETDRKVNRGGADERRDRRDEQRRGRKSGRAGRATVKDGFIVDVEDADEDGDSDVLL